MTVNPEGTFDAQRMMRFLTVLALGTLSFLAVGCDGQAHWMSVDTRPAPNLHPSAPSPSDEDVTADLALAVASLAADHGFRPAPPDPDDPDAPRESGPFPTYVTDVTSTKSGNGRVWLSAAQTKPGLYRLTVVCFPFFDADVARSLRAALKARMKQEFPDAKLRFGLSGW